MTKDTLAVTQLREFMADNRLLTGNAELSEEQIQRIYRRATAQPNNATEIAIVNAHRPMLNYRYVLAASIAIAMVLSGVLIFRPRTLPVETVAISSPAPAVSPTQPIPMATPTAPTLPPSPTAAQTLNTPRKLRPRHIPPAPATFNTLPPWPELQPRLADGKMVNHFELAQIDTWIAPDASGRYNFTRLPGEDFTAELLAAVPITSPADSSQDIEPGVFNWDVENLPRDPESLRIALLNLSEDERCHPENVGTQSAESGLSETQCLVEKLMQLNLLYVTPPDLTAAIWQVVAQSPDLRSLGETVDPLGRPAIAVATEFPTGAAEMSTETFFISRETGRLIATETMMPTGGTMERLDVHLWLESGFVPNIGDRLPTNQI